MTFLRFFSSLVPVFFIGGSALTLIRRWDSSFSWAERAALSFGLGWGILTYEMFFFSLVLLPWNSFLLLLPWLGLLPFWLWKRKRKPEPTHLPPRVPLTSLERNLFLFLLFLFLYLVIKALTLPMTYWEFWDAWSTWGHKAKAFALRRSVDFSFFTDPSRAYARQEYPLLLPLSESWIYLGLGKIDEQTVRLLSPLFYLFFLILFWGACRRERNRQVSFLLTTCLATLPMLLEHAERSYADLPLTFYYTFSTLSLYFWCKEGKREDLWIGLLFSAFAAWTKNEGQALFIINAFVFGIGRFFFSSSRARKKLFEGLLLLSPLLLLLPWRLLLIQLEVPSELLPQLKGAVFLTQAHRLPLILKTFFLKLLDLPRWNLLWGGLLFFGSLSWRKTLSFPMATLVLALLFHWVLYIFVYLMQPINFPLALEDDSYNRLLFHAAPLSLFLLGSFLAWGTASSSDRIRP